MENAPSFNLNRAIQSWRDDLGQSPAFRGENLDELESHLRDSAAALESCGLSAEEAFLIAAKRMGGSGTLEREFGKVNQETLWLDRLFWMLIGLQVWGFISGAIGLVTRNALVFGLNGAGYDFKAHGYTIPTILFTLVNLAGFAGSLTFCWWLFQRKGQRLGRWLGRWLHRRTTWVVTFGAFYLLAFSFSLAQWGMQSLLFTSLDRERIGEIAVSQSFSSAFTLLITTAIFIWLTLFLARKRLRPGVA
jgi:hypothetical protein